ncbi:hypothetical protein RJ640_012243 [Escallonia rubra]|uniref:NB-ARC domain-containing protein n=1 Tax=Escallonia rubra TaxID=112253 RepID=A0AA88QWN0_9ASTE|nr:hypothetical protein RJ640_012243 [Escallonia rubra]
MIASYDPYAYSMLLSIAHKIKAINLSLDDIYKEANEIGLKPVDSNSSAGAGHLEVLRTHPGIVDSEKIVGRDADVSMVADVLVMQNNENGLPVVGMPGQGKTTLAKLICKNDKVVRHFDELIWVSVTDDIENKRILNEMVQSLTQTNPQLSNMGGILKELRKHLNRKKYLVVLDDVWNEIPGKWESLRDALLEIGGSSESKVLDVRITEEAKRANLLKKSHINALQFHWSGKEEENTNEVVSEEVDTDENVLEGLTPHSNLKRLTVQNFRGKNFSSWMMMPSQSSVIPILGHLSCLKFIHIEGLTNVKRIGAEYYGHNAEVATSSCGGISAGGAMFPALRNLHLAELDSLEQWLEALHPSPFVKVFRCLEELELTGLYKLSMVPSHFPAIKDLTICGINDAQCCKR